MRTKSIPLYASFFAVFILLAGMGVWSFLDVTSQHLSSKIGSLEIDQSALKENELPTRVTSVFTEEDDGEPINILVIGSDSREGLSTNYGDPNIITGARSDTTMIIHLSGDRTSATVLSIPRDTIVGIPNCDPYNPQSNNNEGAKMGAESLDRFNQAYNIGGANCVVKTVNMLTGIPINHVIEVDFGGFEQMVDAVGGLTVCLNQPVVDADAMLDLPAGEYKVNGKDALGLMRARYVLGDGSDLMRIERQQLLVGTLLQQVKQSGILDNPKNLYDLTVATLGSLKTDRSLNNINSLMSLAVKGNGVEVDSVQFYTLPTLPNDDGITVRVDGEKAKKIFTDIIYDGKVTSPTVVPSPPVPSQTPQSAEPTPTSSPAPTAQSEIVDSGDSKDWGICQNVPPFN